MKIQLMLMHKVTIFANWIFKSFVNRFISLFTFLVIPYIIIFQYSITGIISILIASALLSLTIIRVSNNLNLNLITGTLNMNLLNPKEYWKFSYIEEKSKISEKFKYDFIEGILTASHYRKNTKMETHKWIVENVINEKHIIANFRIKAKETRKAPKLSSEILILIDREELRNEYKIIKEIISRKRTGYTVKLRRVKK